MQTQSYLEDGQESAQNAAQSHNPVLVNSLLVADCGSVFTKVSLLGLVEGQYRLIARGEAPTTISAPQEDITIGIIQAINVIEYITGRRFIEEQRIISPERDTGDGVDAFIAMVSAGGSLRVAVLGAVNPTFEALAMQAVSGLYAEAQAIAAPSFVATSSSGPSWSPDRITQEWERQLSRMREFQPQAALIVGLADGPAGPNALQEACQLLVNAFHDRNEQYATRGPLTPASQYPGSQQFSVVYAGAMQYVDAVRRMLQGVAETTRVDPLVSSAQLSAISVAIGALHEHNVIQHVSGYQLLREWSSAVPVATATSLSSLVRFLAQHYAMSVTAVDVGGTNTTIMAAGEHGEFIPLVNSGIGVGPGLGAILQQVGLQQVARWLPFNVAEEEIRQFVLNRMLHPHVIPSSVRELQICQAFAREAMILTMEELKKNAPDWPNTDLILATGGILSHTPRYGQVALMLLDALQPRGVTSLVLDKTMLISQLGAVATVAPIMAVQVNENDAVTHRLGTCVIPFGDLQQGQLAVRVGVEYSNGRQLTVDVMAGSIEIIPLRLNEQALLTLFPAPNVDVGLGPGERARAAEEIDGGLVGLIIDARGRPLALPSDETERQARLLQWAQALGA